MLSWTIGDVTVKRVVEIEMPVAYHDKHPFLPGATPEALSEIPWLYPNYVTPEGALRLSIHALLVEAPGLRLVVDTCIGNDRPRRIAGNQALATDFLSRMAEAGWERDSVDAVVCTHLHVDHVGWNTMLEGDKWVPTFPKARYLIGRKEYEHWMGEGDEEQQVILSDSIAPIFEAGLAELVDMDHRLSPEVRLVPTAGHTPGHVSVAIESKGERALITGDFMHHPSQIARPHWCPPFDHDTAASTQTRKAMIEDLADGPVLVIGTHFAAPTAGHIVRDGDSYRFDA
jgi:glyoxylase-like metal-dependent hydrolase (beta-lactamase superfamily II)